MIKYKYNKCENKFTENGHTMFEEDVLLRLQRLADLEEQITKKQLLPVSGTNKKLCSCSSKILPDGNIQFRMCRNCQEEMNKELASLTLANKVDARNE